MVVVINMSKFPTNVTQAYNKTVGAASKIVDKIVKPKCGKNSQIREPVFVAAGCISGGPVGCAIGYGANKAVDIVAPSAKKFGRKIGVPKVVTKNLRKAKRKVLK